MSGCLLLITWKIFYKIFPSIFEISKFSLKFPKCSPIFSKFPIKNLKISSKILKISSKIFKIFSTDLKIISKI